MSEAKQTKRKEEGNFKIQNNHDNDDSSRNDVQTLQLIGQ